MFFFRRRRFLLIPVILGAGAALAGFGFGHHGRCGGRDPARMARHVNAFVDDRLDDLEATDAQRKEIHATVEGLLGELKGMHAEREDMREQFLSFFEAENPDPKAVHAAVDARIEKLRALAHKVADAGLKIHNTLSPAQRAELTKGVRDHDCGGDGDGPGKPGR